MSCLETARYLYVIGNFLVLNLISIMFLSFLTFRYLICRIMIDRFHCLTQIAVALIGKSKLSAGKSELEYATTSSVPDSKVNTKIK